MFRPNNLTVDTTSIASSLITMGAKTAAGLAKLTARQLIQTCSYINEPTRLE